MMNHWLMLNWSKIWPWLSLAIALIFIPLALRGYVYVTTKKFRYRHPEKVPKTPVAIVFGAGVWADGTPTPMLADRLTGAVALYQRGKVKKLLMSGDRSGPDYDEVTAMRDYAESLGVPTADIILDYAGFNTYETCHRATEIFGITQAVFVTQNFHLPRAVYIGRVMGIQAIGLGTRDWGWYGIDSISYHTLREIVATAKALWQVHLTRPRPISLNQGEKNS
jgi:vancomycin permeability regulator SanA